MDSVPVRQPAQQIVRRPGTVINPRRQGRRLRCVAPYPYEGLAPGCGHSGLMIATLNPVPSLTRRHRRPKLLAPAVALVVSMEAAASALPRVKGDDARTLIVPLLAAPRAGASPSRTHRCPLPCPWPLLPIDARTESSATIAPPVMINITGIIINSLSLACRTHRLWQLVSPSK